MKKRHTEEQIVKILEEAKAGLKVEELCRKHGISPATYYSWKSKYGGMKIGLPISLMLEPWSKIGEMTTMSCIHIRVWMDAHLTR